MNIMYYCTGCSYKTTDSSSLIQGKGGCSSCGKSGHKCPRCGMMVKTRRLPGPPSAPISTSIETGIKLNVSGQGQSEKSYGRNIKIKRVK